MNAKKARQFAILKEVKEYHETHAKRINEMLIKMGIELYDEFVEDGIQSFRISAYPDNTDKPLFLDGQDRILKPETKLKPYVTEENYAPFLAWMRKEGFSELIKENINANTLSAWTKKRQEENMPLPPEELMRVFTITTTKVTRAPKGARRKTQAEETQDA